MERNKLKKKMTAQQVEVAVARHLGYRENLIIPNVSHGFLHYEADLLIVTKAGCLTEVEIKVSKNDLVKLEKKKRHNHDDHRIKYLYFAIPHVLLCHHQHIPKRAGIMILDWVQEQYRLERNALGYMDYVRCDDGKWVVRCKVVRKPEKHSKYTISDHERYTLARLGALRIWDLKEKLNDNHTRPIKT